MTTSSLDTIKAREESLLCRTYGRYPVSIASGKGSRVTDLDGKEYVDLLAGIAVTSLGHCNEEIAQVIEKQARKLIHVSNLFYQEEQLELAEELLSLSHFGKAFFCNSGAEANEAQIKLARRYMQRVKNVDAYEIITLDKAFHGRTYATMAATGQERFQDGFAPIPDGFKTVPWGDLNVLEAAHFLNRSGVAFADTADGLHELAAKAGRALVEMIALHDPHDFGRHGGRQGAAAERGGVAACDKAFGDFVGGHHSAHG